MAEMQENPKQELEVDINTRDAVINSGEKPASSEIWTWYLYGLCSYFVHTVLIPIVFPLIISQTELQNPQASQRISKCEQNEIIQLYEGLVNKAIKLGGGFTYSALEWTSISWITGLILSAPMLCLVSILLDYGRSQQLIAGAATGIGALSCLPAGFFRKSWVFPPYIAFIVAANTVVGASHARHLGLMIRGFTGSNIPKKQFPNRRSFGSYLSLYSTAAGCLGAAIMSSFTYHMMRHSDHFTALWVVSIFSGLKWGLGMAHIFSTTRAITSAQGFHQSFPFSHVVSIFKYPHASGSLVGVFLSSFISMCVFASAVLYATGSLCLETSSILYLWLIYFMVPLVSLPLIHPLQRIMRSDAEKMQLLGLLLSNMVSGFGFYYRSSRWNQSHLFLFAAIQGTATGILHAFGRVLWLDCSPADKEGTFSVWFSWARALGSCAGFALATSMPGNIGKAFGISFCSGILGIVVLIFGNISSFRGAKDAGHVIKSESSSPEVVLSRLEEDDDDGAFKGAVTTIVVKDPDKADV